MFFNSEIGIELSFFGPWHLLQIFITALVVFLIYFYRKQLREFKHEKTLRYIIAGTLLVIELSLHVWHLANNDYYIVHMLPLNLCTINVYASIVIIFSKKNQY